MKLTRRELAAGLLAASPSMSQTVEQPRTPEEELRVRLEQARSDAKQLAAFAIPMATEPAFQFKP